MSALDGARVRHGATTAPRGAWSAPAGLKIFVPGYAQWSWGQRERAGIFFGSFAVALGVAAFTWGTPLGLAIVAFAFVTHVVSAVDVVRQAAFPAFSRWTPWISASGGLGLGVYAPALGLASLVAWPASDPNRASEGYLVNCMAYRARAPQQGEWVWLRSSPWSALRIGRVVAGAGQEVDWSENRLRVDGEPSWSASPVHSGRPPERVSFTVPEGHVLVDPAATADAGSVSGGLVLVPHTELAGHAWARLYPLHDRCLLP